MPPWFILCGNEENWRIAIKEGVWGINPRLSRLWEGLSKGDIVFFHVTRSLKRIIGAGSVIDKCDPQNHPPKPIWPDEINKGRVLYPHRFEFETIYVCENPMLKGISIRGLKMSKQKGMSRIRDRRSLLELHRRVIANWNVELPLPEDVVRSQN